MEYRAVESHAWMTRTFIFSGHGLGLFGPLEWLWRSLTYRQLAPLRRCVAGVVLG